MLAASRTLRNSSVGRYLAQNSSAGLKKFSTAAESETDIKTLSNGIKLIVDRTPTHFAGIGMYIDAGSRYEDQTNLIGASHLTDRMAFKSTENFTGKQMIENLNLLGGNYICASSREAMVYQASTFKPDVEKMYRLLSETISKPLYTEEEVQDQITTASYELSEIWLQHDLILPELLQQAAYNHKTLGSPLLCPPEQLEHINREYLMKYRDLFYRPENLVVAMSGVSMEQATELTEKYFEDFKSKSTEIVTKEKASYTGGEISIPSPEEMSYLEEFHHIHVGFEGVPITDENVYTLATLQMLLGGGGSFSAGGPGKGMYSRAYTRVLNQYGFVESCKSFLHNFTDSGLFGLSLSCVPNADRVMGELLGYELSLLFSRDVGKGALSENEVKRAKNQLKSSLMMNLEARMVKLEDMGRQLQIYGKRVGVLEMCEKIDKVTKEDLIKIAEKVLTGSEPTIVIQGDREAFGDVKGTLSRFGIGSSNSSTSSTNDSETVRVEKPKKKGWFG